MLESSKDFIHSMSHQLIFQSLVQSPCLVQHVDLTFLILCDRLLQVISLTVIHVKHSHSIISTFGHQSDPSSTACLSWLLQFGFNCMQWILASNYIGQVQSCLALSFSKKGVGMLSVQLIFPPREGDLVSILNTGSTRS